MEGEVAGQDAAFGSWHQHLKQFSSLLDLQSGYHQVFIAAEDVQKTASKFHMGLFELRVLSFGLTHAPAVLQNGMHTVFGHFQTLYCTA